MKKFNSIWSKLVISLRDEDTMYQMILNYAKSHEEIRAVILNGSRANLQRVVDPFNDYDIVYLVNDLTLYKNKEVHHDFGPLLIYERTDISELFEENFADFVCYLMQFKDGNRIDLTIAEMKDYRRYCFEDHLAIVLLDKDGVIEPLPTPNDHCYDCQGPTKQMFYECRTEFWWVSIYVAKGLWRKQILYAQDHMENCIRKMLRQMLVWYVVGTQGHGMNLGKCQDGLKNHLPKDIWKRYLQTYATCQEKEIWQALFRACDLFNLISNQTANIYHFRIDDCYDREVSLFLQYIKQLPRSAKELDLEGLFDK